MTSERQSHWDQVYATRAVDRVSWFQVSAETSMRMIRDSDASKDSAIIDIGAGASVLVDELLEAGFSNVSVLDISERALEASMQRLGVRQAGVQWIVADVLEWEPRRAYDVWHDRAVFHFLTDKRDRGAYRSVLIKGLRKGGALILATFAEDGPERCSGLPVHRWSVDALADELSSEFRLMDSSREMHRTPAGVVQPFTWARFERV